METQNLRELIIEMEAEMSTAYNKGATIGQIMRVANMVEKEISELKTRLAAKN